MVLTVACAPAGVNNSSNTSLENPATQNEVLIWEKTVPASKSWSKYIFKTISAEHPEILSSNIATDVELFCSNYKSLSTNKKIVFWGQLFAAIAKYESAWVPNSRMVETTMGNDPITHEQVASEGLLQLSYQDTLSYGSNCDFDWSVDKKYHHISPTDSRKSIFDSYKNLRCGIHILARQLKIYNAITVEKGVYWAVIKKNGSHHKIREISAITQSLSVCQKK